MSIEIGSTWVKDGEVVEVFSLRKNNYGDGGTEYKNGVWFKDAVIEYHVLTESDFLEQYKPYEVVYEYLYALDYEYIGISEKYYTDDDDFKKRNEQCVSFQRLDFTKRERK